MTVRDTTAGFQCCTCKVYRLRAEFGTRKLHGHDTRTSKCIKCLENQRASKARKAGS